MDLSQPNGLYSTSSNFSVKQLSSVNVEIIPMHFRKFGDLYYIKSDSLHFVFSCSSYLTY